MNAGNHPFRKQAHHRQINGANQGQALQNPADIFAGGAARANARNKAAVLAHIIGKFGGIEHDAYVEECEQQNHRYVQQGVQRFTPFYSICEGFDKGIFGAEDERDGSRKGQQRTGKNWRNDATGVDAQRQVRRLPAHNAAAHNTFRVLHRNAALSTFHKDDESNDGNHQGEEHDNGKRSENAPCASLKLFVKIEHGARQAYDDAHENDERHAIADTAFADLLTQPHDKG